MRVYWPAHLICRGAFILTVVCLPFESSNAQSTASLEGEITDQNGVAIQGVEVVVSSAGDKPMVKLASRQIQLVMQVLF